MVLLGKMGLADTLYPHTEHRNSFHVYRGSMVVYTSYLYSSLVNVCIGCAHKRKYTVPLVNTAKAMVRLTPPPTHTHTIHTLMVLSLTPKGGSVMATFNAPELLPVR